jgi:hypothetical protein
LETFPQLRDRTVTLIGFLESVGVRVPRSSRLREYLRQLEAACRANGVTVPAHLDLSKWHRSLTEIDDLDFVARELSQPPKVRGWDRAMRLCLAGGVRRADEVKHSGARDIQFELVTAAMLRRAGFAVELAEPDVLIHYKDGRFGIAAKRPRSIKKLRANICDADKQIGRSGMQGIIAVDLSCVFNRNDAHLVTGSFGAANAYVKQIANEFVRRNAHRVVALVDTMHTFGFLAHFAAPIFDTATPRLAHARRWTFSNLCSFEDPRTKLLMEIADQLGTKA